MKKTVHYLAIPKGDQLEEHLGGRIFDMLRYDRCHPISNAPEGWVVLRQPWVEGMRGGFTFARWSSFGIKTVLTTATSVVTEQMPVDFIAELQRLAFAAREQDVSLITIMQRHANPLYLSVVK